jgi:hypothetical protein
LVIWLVNFLIAALAITVSCASSGWLEQFLEASTRQQQGWPAGKAK